MTSRLRKTLSMRTVLSVSIAFLLCLSIHAAAQDRVDLRGYVAARTVDCLNPKHHNHAPEFFLVDDATGERVKLVGYDKQLSTLHPRQKVSIRGMRVRQAAKKTKSGDQEPIEIQQFEILPITEEYAQEPPVANGANSLTKLSTLLVFISTNTHACMTSETNARNRLFNNTNNANLGMQAITKGRYGLQLGNGTGVPDDHTINLFLNVNSADHDSRTIEFHAINKLFASVASGGMGLNRLDWNRILLFAPGGIEDSGFTAYSYYPYGAYTTSGQVSMYGGSYGNNRMNGYLHELGHNFGFAHSSKGSSEYGDRTCVMGLSNNGTRTETYNVAKLLQTNWLDAFPNAKKSITSDTTLDLYPLSSDPNVVTNTIAVNFPGTDYYAAYHRNQEPYGYLSQTNDRDKVFVYTRASGNYTESFQVANLAVGGSYTGSGKVLFERYGPNKAYATVSFDLNDGNAKPVANAQAIAIEANVSKATTLTGSDSDNNPLIYTVVSPPSNGVLSGNAPNLTYSPNIGYLGTDSFVFKVHDGKISSFATVSITVNPPLPSIYALWAGQTFSHAFTSIGPNDNPDGDSYSNLLEFAFGTDPTLQDGGSLVSNGTAHGNPVPIPDGTGGFELYFMRRVDHNSPGSVGYTVQFSDDLASFTNSTVTPSFVATSSINSAYEVVKVPFPPSAKFGRVRVDAVP